MNTYEQVFFAKCPRTKARVKYQLTIDTLETIFVEDIQAFVDEIKEDYHETIAEQLHEQFGGNQTLEAHHHGTDVRTTRP